MKRIIVILAAFFLFACAKEDNTAIKGTAVGMKDGTTLYLQELGENNRRIPIDTAIITTEEFVFDNTIEGESGLMIITPSDNPRQQLLLVKDKNPLKIVLYKDSLAASLVSGSKENELFNTYRNKARQQAAKKQTLLRKMQQAQRETDGIAVEMAQKEIAALDANFIKEKRTLLEDSNDKMVSIMALSDLINAKVLTIAETETYFESLSDNVKSSSIGESVEKYIAQLKSQRIAEGVASVGNKAPDFSAATPDGKDLALADALGKYTIIDFWASWCRPCRQENPNVVNVYNEYHDKGLNIISVSLDRPGQDDRWKKAIKDDEMDWYHVSNLQFWQDPIPRSYGVRAIPATFLLDENGVIIAKNLRGPALGAKMKELLGDS